MFELSAFSLLLWAAWGSAALWLLLALMTLRGLKRQKPLGPAPRKRLRRDNPTLVSILVPARNEEGRVLAECIRSILAQDYERFEVITVNDRSTDATGTILHAIAKADERLRVIDGVEPPAGWLGKPHALQQALDAAQGEWILATDADIIFHEAALRTAVDHAIVGGFDAVTLIPRIETRSFWEHVFAPTFGWFMAIGMPVDRVNDPRRREAIAVGGFFLIRREELRRVGDYSAVRAEVAEDLRMAELMKHSGSRLRIEYAPDLTSTRMYAGLGEIWLGFSKNFFAGMRFSLLQTAASIVAVLLFMVAPVFVAIASAIALAYGLEGPWLTLLMPTAAVWLTQVLTFAVINRFADVPLQYALTVPLGFVLFVAILMNSAFKIATGAGVMWKDRIIYERESATRPTRERQQPPDFPAVDEQS